MLEYVGVRICPHIDGDFNWTLPSDCTSIKIQWYKATCKNINPFCLDTLNTTCSSWLDFDQKERFHFEQALFLFFLKMQLWWHSLNNSALDFRRFILHSKLDFNVLRIEQNNILVSFSCQWNAPPLFDLIYQLHISLCLFVIPLCFMVFTYRGIAKVLWGSLPMERFFNDEKRAINSSQHTLSGRTILLKEKFWTCLI